MDIFWMISELYIFFYLYFKDNLRRNYFVYYINRTYMIICNWRTFSQNQTFFKKIFISLELADTFLLAVRIFFYMSLYSTEVWTTCSTALSKGPLKRNLLAHCQLATSSFLGGEAEKVSPGAMGSRTSQNTESTGTLRMLLMGIGIWEATTFFRELLGTS